MKKKELQISYKQQLWLIQQGDRDVNDIENDEGGMFIYTKAYPLGLKKVYLPDDKNLKIKILGSIHEAVDVI